MYWIEPIGKPCFKWLILLIKNWGFEILITSAKQWLCSKTDWHKDWCFMNTCDLKKYHVSWKLIKCCLFLWDYVDNSLHNNLWNILLLQSCLVSSFIAFFMTKLTILFSNLAVQPYFCLRLKPYIGLTYSLGSGNDVCIVAGEFW